LKLPLLLVLPLFFDSAGLGCLPPSAIDRESKVRVQRLELLEQTYMPLQKDEKVEDP
jgi:hypothetical protein